jgi:hypothetical protein
MLFVYADTPEADEAAVYRRRTLTRGADQQLIQCVRVGLSKGETRRKFFNQQPVEAAAGTLRLARRGDQIYYLFAENDSRQFRLLGQEPFSTGDLQLEGVRIVTRFLAMRAKPALSGSDWRFEPSSSPARQCRNGALWRRS